MAVIFTDNFNTGTEPDTNNWVENGGDWDIVGTTEVRCITITSGVTGLVTTTTAHAAVANVLVTCSHTGGAQVGSQDGGPIARVSGTFPNATYYAANAYANGALEIWRYNGSPSGTLIGTGTTGLTFASGNIIGLRVEGTGATVTLTSYYGATLTQREQTTDTSGSRITAAGQTGIFTWVNGTDLGDYDDFSVDNITDPTIGIKRRTGLRPAIFSPGLAR